MDMGDVSSVDANVPHLEVTCYTDPLCPWSWAMEPQWRRFRSEYGVQLDWRNVMGGMIADWPSYNDALNSIHNPAQMAAHWYHIRQLTGAPFDETLWSDDPP